jgi:hypothetical protein
MKLKIGSSTGEQIYNIKNIADLKGFLELGMKSLNCEKCNFELKGEAEIKKVVELSCLFG